MSDDKPKPQLPSWCERLVQGDPELAIRDAYQHIRLYAPTTVDGRGDVDIRVPEQWRKGKPTVPEYIPHTKNPGTPRFSKGMKHAAVLWFDGKFFDPHRPMPDFPHQDTREEMKQRLYDFAGQLGKKTGIDFEYEVYMPDYDFRGQVGNVSAVLVLAAPEKHASKLRSGGLVDKTIRQAQKGDDSDKHDRGAPPSNRGRA